MSRKSLLVTTVALSGLLLVLLKILSHDPLNEVAERSLSREVRSDPRPTQEEDSGIQLVHQVVVPLPTDEVRPDGASSQDRVELPDPLQGFKKILATFRSHNPDLIGFNEMLAGLAYKARIQGLKSDGNGRVVIERTEIEGRYDISSLSDGRQAYAISLKLPGELEDGGKQSVAVFFREDKDGRMRGVSASIQYFPKGGSDPKDLFPGDGDYILGYRVWFDENITKISATKCLYHSGNAEIIEVDRMSEAEEYAPTIKDLQSYELWLRIMRNVPR